MEHSDLVAEMVHVERLTTQERLHLARHRRLQQLKVWRQREKEWLRHQTKHPSNKRSIFFDDSVMLLEAAARNDIDEVRRLLKKGVNPDSTNEDGLTALHQCCIDDNEEMMKLLVEFGANVNAEDSEKWTPLHAAATCGHLHLVRYLITSGANLLAVNADGNMPYDICEDERTLDCIEGEMASRGVTQELIDETRASTEVQMLQDLQKAVSLGQDLEYKDHQGATPLHIAAANGYLRVVEYLLDQHVSTDVEDNDKWQPVHAAACWGHLEVLELLVQNGADLNAKNKHDETPADICEDPEIRERIVELKTEQESKKLREAQSRRVRRSQSINTRTQSVRRTSIRDKVLTTKKDAQEEARLRLQAQQTYAPTKPTDSIILANNSNVQDKTEESDSTALTPAVRRGPEGKDNDSFLHEDVDKDSVTGPDSPVNRQQPIYESDNNGKINIHVSVVFVKSLSDLKKQRAQSRHTNPTVDANGNGIPVSSTSDNDLTANDFQRFSGNTSEIIGDSHTEQRCCVVM
ncbi:protein phosphatase 1 regulatory subunit 16A isoform X2 [Microplitis mediator]|uniref:protein phosphatase 1 regulatory subunit 16A isoform X1 n=1 Tax=Microplitis mediator TaxID=375433 RepID=UPI00255388DE|nr:protein phosphatase 1 regulatory subunit 16A isoform X1 [Microplitis mediator]XP_057319178.1 protein phosphatase 1 regulatory subunit 16A isoform X2 [Microplitis mediator]